MKKGINQLQTKETHGRFYVTETMETLKYWQTHQLCIFLCGRLHCLDGADDRTFVALKKYRVIIMGPRKTEPIIFWDSIIGILLWLRHVGFQIFPIPWKMRWCEKWGLAWGRMIPFLCGESKHLSERTGNQQWGLYTKGVKLGRFI